MLVVNVNESLVPKSIVDRHKESIAIINESLNNIYSNSVVEFDEVKSEETNEANNLNDIIDETSKILDSLLEDF